jgi:quercetin dioxygenase-like cupin family protein
VFTFIPDHCSESSRIGVWHHPGIAFTFPRNPHLARMRITPNEIRTNQTGTENIGSSLLEGVSTKVLYGDPSKPGFYTIVLSVPAHTTVAAHTQRDDRVATVVSGTWHFGYGDHFTDQALKTLPPGSVYSEPAGGNHFAKTGGEAVLVRISGYGPTDTHYVNPADEPKLTARK